MRLCVMVEQNFKNTSSGKMIFKGLKNILRKKRITYKVIASLSDIEADNHISYLFLISTNRSYISKTILECESKKVHPIVISLQLLNSLSGIYSSVTPNLEHSMFQIMNFFKNNHKKSPAFYGISVNSAPDISRKNCFLKKHILPTSESDIFYNRIGLDDCFEAFYNKINQYDCVICANNYVAIHLINELRAKGINTKDFAIISYGNTFLATKFYPEIITVYVENETLGKTGVIVLEQLLSNKDILNINMSVNCVISSETNFSTEYLMENDDSFEEGKTDIFYEDSYIQDMLLAENLLSSCDATDMQILDLVLKEYSYDDIAAKSFLSYGAVKYRVKNMLQMCNCSSKSQFIEFMKTYM